MFRKKEKDSSSRKRKSLRNQILQASLPSIWLTCAVSIMVYSYFTYTRAYDSTLESFEQIVTTATMVVEGKVDSLERNVQQLGETADMFLNNMTNAEKTEYLEQVANEYGFKSLYVANVSGISNTGVNFESYEFFTIPISGKTYLASPQVTVDGSSTDIMIAAPLWRSGKVGTFVNGVVVAVLDGKTLSDIVSGIDIGEDGGLYLIDENGTTIADNNYDYVLSQENTIKQAESDSSLKLFAEAERKALAGSPMSTIVDYEGDKCFLHVAPITSRGWAVGALAPTWGYMSHTMIAMFISIVLAAILGLVGAGYTAYIVRRVFNPVSAFVEAVGKVAEGNYDVRLSYDKDDEMGDMQSAIMSMIERNRECIDDLSSCLEAMANGDFTQELTADYPGVFKQLKISVEAIISSLGSAIIDSRGIAESVASGAEQMASGSGNLSAGAIQQASSTEELAATVQAVTEHVHNTSNLSAEAKTVAEDTSSLMDTGSEQMKELVASMAKIYEKSSSISKIIKSIEDIAFQTNILALNAAVEAARAGSAGKGFAVVADEVRNLAQKSAESAQSTNILITESMKAVDEGVECVQRTQMTMDEVAEAIHKISAQVIEIASAANEQSAALTDISSGVESIAAITQMNSATAEEVAATSGSLSEQATSLQHSMSHFRVADGR